MKYISRISIYMIRERLARFARSPIIVLAMCGIRTILENATALGSRIPPHAVLLQVNNTPVKLKIIFAI